MSNKDEVFEYLIDQLRQRANKFDVVAEVHKMSIDRAITGRSGYSDVENEIIDAYIGRDSDSKQTVHNLQQQLACKEDVIRMLKDGLLREVDKVRELRDTIEHMNADFNQATQGPEQSCCRKEDAQVGEPWIKWEGGECPEPGKCKVQVRFRDGSMGKRLAGEYRWDIRGNKQDIVVYRVIE
ncbi:hypothetical protein [Salmonella phage L223]|nr:hypothetical protein [Salmonella phage L223]